MNDRSEVGVITGRDHLNMGRLLSDIPTFKAYCALEGFLNMDS